MRIRNLAPLFFMALTATAFGCEEEDPIDGGPDASSMDGGTPDSSSAADSGEAADVGAVPDSGPADSGAAVDAGESSDAGVDAGAMCPECAEGRECDIEINMCVFDCGGIRCTPDEVCDLTGFYCTMDPMQCGDSDRCGADEICDGVGCVVECGGIQCTVGQVCTADGMDCTDA